MGLSKGIPDDKTMAHVGCSLNMKRTNQKGLDLPKQTWEFRERISVKSTIL